MKVKTYTNGLRLLTIPDEHALTATIMILVGTGSNYESENEQGISHFVEHMLFKGSSLFASSREISVAFEKIGAVSNAFTSNEYTGYYAKGAPKHVPTFLTILSDIYTSATFPVEEIEKEKGVVVEEIAMYEDMPQHVVGEALVKTMYPGSPRGRSVAGTKESVRSLSQKQLLAYTRKHYVPSNTIVVASGNIDPKEVEHLVKKTLGTHEAATVKSTKTSATLQKTFAQTFVPKPVDQAHISIGFHGFALGAPEGPAAVLLATILGRGMSSRLFQLLREELGVAYYVSATHDAYKDYGIFELSLGVEKSQKSMALKKIADVLTDLKNTEVTADELAKAREYTLGTARLGLEASDEIAAFFGVQLLLRGSYKTVETLAKEYKAVTPEDIKALARRLFISKNASLAYVGQKEDLDTTPFASL